jgi:hypothetical protein
MKSPLIIRRLRRNPAALGLSISAALLIGLLLYEVILNRFTVISKEEDLLWGFGTAVVSILLVGYLVGAYSAVLHSTRNTIDELKNTWEIATDASSADSAGSIGKKGFFAMGLVGALLTAITHYLTAKSAWDWSAWRPETWWHRVPETHRRSSRMAFSEIDHRAIIALSADTCCILGRQAIDRNCSGVVVQMRRIK